jgi:hypothetical protein
MVIKYGEDLNMSDKYMHGDAYMMLKSGLRDAAELVEFALLMALFSVIFFVSLIPVTAYCLVKAGRGFRRCLSDILIEDYDDYGEY